MMAPYTLRLGLTLEPRASRTPTYYYMHLPAQQRFFNSSLPISSLAPLQR